MAVLRRLVHVDDDPLFLELVAQVLGDAGWEVVSTEDPALTIEMLNASGARLLITDLKMPGQSGLELLRAVKEFDGGIPVVVLTGLVTQASVLESLRFGAEACFFKPVEDFAPLIGALEMCHARTLRWWATLNELTQRRRAAQEFSQCDPALPR